MYFQLHRIVVSTKDARNLPTIEHPTDSWKDTRLPEIMSSLAASNLFSVNGLVAVVTGGGTGIGLMIARALEHNGAKVYILGRREEILKTAAKKNAVCF